MSAYIKADADAAAIGTTFSFYIGGDRVIEKTAKAYQTENINQTVNGTLTTSNSTIECVNSYGSGDTHSTVYTVTVNYR